MAELSSRFEAALVFASQLHRTQRRKTTRTPYVGHLLGVASIVLEHGGDEDEAIAALLHDAVEDQGGLLTRGIILQRFGDRVTSIVDGCTEERWDQTITHRQRKQTHLESIRTASPSVALVYASDKLHNGQTLLSAHKQLGQAVWPHFTGGADTVVWYYGVARESVRGRIPPALFEQLEQTVRQIEELVHSEHGGSRGSTDVDK
jgi:GTP pyrophosphokinase